MAAREPFDTLTLHTLDPLTPVSLQNGEGGTYAAVRHADCAVRLLATPGSVLRDLLDGGSTTGLWEQVPPGRWFACRSCGRPFVMEATDG
jgi:hypothetical protein